MEDKMLFLGLVVVAIAITYGIYWYYNNRLSSTTKKALENEVKADVKDTAFQVKAIGESTVEGAVTKVTKTVKKKLNNG